MRKSWQNLLLVLAMVAFAMTFSAVAGSAPDPEFSCFLVADDGPSDGSGGQVNGEPENLLTAVNPDDPDPATNEVDVGPTGTEGIEAIAVQPSTGNLYAADGGQLGTLDQDTGAFTASASPIGTGDGAAGEVEFDNVDGLTFDPDTGILYGSQRENGAPDLLLQIDPATGAHVSGAFGGDDYAVIDPVAGLTDIDDIAMNSSTLFGAANEGGDDGRLISIDPANGDTTDIGATGVDDIEGLGFHADGRLLGISGKDAPLSAIYEIDTSTGVATEVAEVDNGLDYEAIDCRGEAVPPEPTQVGGTKWNDANENGVRDEGEEGVGGVEIEIFNEDGSVDMETETAEDGSYVFDVPPGTYTVCEEVPAGRIQTFPTEGPSCGEREDDDDNGGEDNGGDRPREDAGTAADDNDDNGDDNGDGRDRDDDNGDGRDRDDDDPEGRHRRSVGHTVTVAEGEQSLDNDFGNVAREICNDGKDNDGDGLVDADDPDCNISGVKWNDANGDGVRDEGEEGVGGVTILLFDEEGEVAGHTRTGRGGVYGFFRAEEGSYTVCEVLPEGGEQTFPTEGPDCSEFEPERPRDARLGPVGHEATVDEETQDRNNDFGNTGDGQPPECPADLTACNVTGLKWDDADASGTREEGEVALGGITIHALQDGTMVEETTTKDVEEEEGNYGFLLEPGTYTICEVLSEERTQTFPTSGADCDALETEGVDYGPFGYEVTITADEKHPDNDFGNTGDGNGPTCSEDLDEDGFPHSSFDPEADEVGPLSEPIHGLDQALPFPVGGDGGVVTEVNCAIVAGLLGL